MVMSLYGLKSRSPAAGGGLFGGQVGGDLTVESRQDHESSVKVGIDLRLSAGAHRYQAATQSRLRTYRA